MLTNDGDIVNEILRSENNHEKEYIVRVNRPITDLALSMLAGGVKIMGEMTKPCRVERIDRESFRMILTQGLNRQIRRMCSALGYRVQRLQRVRIMNVRLGKLATAVEWRYLTESPRLVGVCASIDAVHDAAQVARSTAAAPPPTIAVPRWRASPDLAPCAASQRKKSSP